MKQREHRPEHAPSQTTSGRDHAVSPGKRTLTMGLASRHPLGAAAVQRRPAVAQAMPPGSAAEQGPVEDWMAVALRPDLHQAPIMRKSMNAVGYAGPGALTPPASSGGTAMPAAVQAKMEGALGADFSGVRIHEGPQAQAVGALAYTQGTDIHFAPGQYDPGSQRGQELLGHELTHVVQQAQGRVHATTQAKGVAINHDEGLEREADEMGARAARGVEHAGVLRSSAGARQPGGAVAQLKRKKSNYTPSKPAADVKVGTKVIFLSDTIADGYLTLKTNATGIVRSMSNSRKTLMVEIESNPSGDGGVIGRTVRVDSTSASNFARIAADRRASETRGVLDERLRAFDADQQQEDRDTMASKAREAFAFHGGAMAGKSAVLLKNKAQELLPQLKASPLTINVRVSDMVKWDTPQVLNGFEVAARRGSSQGVGNVGDADKLKKRYHYEHVAFGFPTPYDSDLEGNELAANTWGDGELGESAMSGQEEASVAPVLRPRYGALDFRSSGKGATPDPKWYGQSFLELEDDVKQKSTYTLGDTWDVMEEEYDFPKIFTFNNLDLLLMAALLNSDKSIAQDLQKLTDDSEEALSEYAEGQPYIEAQIHQPISFASNVKQITVSRSELQTQFGDKFENTVSSAKKCLDPDNKWADRIRVWKLI